MVSFTAAVRRTQDPRCYNQSYYLRHAVLRHARMTQQGFHDPLIRLALACGTEHLAVLHSQYPVDQRPIVKDVVAALIAERTAFLSIYSDYVQQRRVEKRSGSPQPRHADLQRLYAPAYFDSRCIRLRPYPARRDSAFPVGYLDAAGEWAIPPQFNGAKMFTYGVAAVRAGDLWGYIDTTGAWVIKPQFNSAREYTDGVAAVAIGKLWGYIDLAGAWLIRPRYIDAGYVIGGVANVYDASYEGRSVNIATISQYGDDPIHIPPTSQYGGDTLIHRLKASMIRGVHALGSTLRRRR